MKMRVTSDPVWDQGQSKQGVAVGDVVDVESPDELDCDGDVYTSAGYLRRSCLSPLGADKVSATAVTAALVALDVDAVKAAEIVALAQKIEAAL